MTSQKLADGTIHKLPADFRKAIGFDATAKSLWADFTPLARNEWICWVTSAKQEATRRCGEFVELRAPKDDTKFIWIFMLSKTFRNLQ